MKESAFVTGSTGFIGSHLACILVESGIKVFGLTRSGVSKNKKFMQYVASGDIELIKGDMEKIDELQLPNVEYIYHVAGKVSVWGKMEEFLDTNCKGTEKLLSLAEKMPNLKCFTYFSSVAVYGFYGYSNIKENGAMRPMKNPYPLSKMLAESIVKEHCRKHNIDFVIIRPGNVYGEYDYTSSYDIYKRVKKEKMMMCGGGKYKSCFVYVGNLVKASQYLSENANCHNTDYNITDGNDMTLRQVLTLIAKNFGVKAKFKNVPATLSRMIAGVVEGSYKLFRIKKAPLITKFTVEQNLHDYSFDISKTLNTGFNIPFTTEEGISNTVKWFNEEAEIK